MKKFIKENILAILNVIIPIISLVFLLFAKLSENVIYLMMISALIGWILPYFVPLITGISMLNKSHYKLSLIFNIIGLLLCIMLLIFTIRLFDKNFIIFLVEYSSFALLNIINIIYYIIYLRKHPNLEYQKIKKAKKENNGIMV